MTNNNHPIAYPDLKGSDRVREECGRCVDGVYTGPSNASWNRQDGRGQRTFCFYCGGAGYVTVLVSSIRARETRERREAAERQAAAERYAAKVEAFWTEERVGIRNVATQAHIELRDGDPLRRELGVALEAIESLDEEAAPVLLAILDRIAERAAAKVATPEGRVDIEGVIVGLKYREPYAYGASGSWAAVIECDGFKLYGTLPSAISAAERGDRVAFTATVERSADDEAFGFYKRPTKARVIAQAAE